jgi:PAS domain S-box-containing protein
MLGYDREELSRLRLGAITDSADLARVQQQYDAIVNDGSRARIDKRYVRKDGSRLAVHERVSVIRDADGKPGVLLLLTFEAVAGEDGMRP